MSSSHDKCPLFYYLLRDQHGDVRAVVRSYQHYGKDAMLGAFRIEETTEAYVETLEEFKVDVDAFEIDKEERRRRIK